MSAESEERAEIVNLDEQIDELRKSLDQLTKSRSAAPEIAVDPLIEQVAKNMSAIRQASGLPPKQPDEFEAEIRQRAEQSREAEEPATLFR